MGTVENLSSQEAVDKIKHVAEHEIAMLCTFTTDGRIHPRPMGTQGVDADGTLWFMSKRNSTKNQQIDNHKKVQLIYSVSGKSEYLSLDGSAEILRDQRKIDELWNPFAKTWFTNGKEDPDITLIRVIPRDGYYWDTKHGKMVSLAKIAVGAMTGKTMDDGVMGRLSP
ncbi:MAG: pyridoxamine 5'-phosphate oxidase family protein [Gemmatimonadaceae bacterium]